MNIRSFVDRLRYSPIPRGAAVALVLLVMFVALAWSWPAFCGEIHDAASNGDLAKVEALLKENPALVFSKDGAGGTPLHWAAERGHMDVANLLRQHDGQDVPKPIEPALAALQGIGEEYKDFKTADASTASVRPESISIRVIGGLRYFTKYSGGKVGAVKLSEQDTQKAKALLEKHVLQTLLAKTNASSPWRLLVKCNERTGAKMGGGAVWKGIPSVESDEDLKGGGISLGFGGSVQPLVTGSLFLLNTKEKLLVFQKDVYAAGSDMDSVLLAFAEAIDNEYSAWSKTTH